MLLSEIIKRLNKKALLSFFVVIMGISTSANELSRQWAVRLSTAHRLEIRRAL